MSRRVLITGGSGFVGANLARTAIAAGHEVHLLLRRGHQPWRLAGIAGQVIVHEGDVTRAADVQRAVGAGRPEWVFHLAVYGAYSHEQDVPRMIDTNVAGTTAVLNACLEFGVESMVHAGSSSEYGYKDHAACEDERIEPNSPYAVTKAAATHYCSHFARAHDINVVTTRLYSIYGPWEAPHRLIPTLIVHGLEGTLPNLVSPDTSRDFVYVDDAVQALLAVAATPGVPRGAVLNVCSGAMTRVREVVEQARTAMNIVAVPAWGTLPGRAWDTDVWVGSPVAMEQATGWRASTSLASGLASTIDWLKTDPNVLRFYCKQVSS